MKVSESKLSFQENKELLYRGLKILNHMTPGVTVLQLLKALCKALIPYIGIYMSAYILTELVSGRNIQKLIFYVAVTIGSTLLAAVLDGTFGYFIKTCETKILAKHEILLNDKSYSMDYAQAEQKETSEMRSQIEINLRAYSGGLNVLFGYCDMLFEGIVSVIIAIAICSKMFFITTPSTSVVIKLVNSWWFSALLLFLIGCALAVLCKAQIKAQQKRLLLNRSMGKFNLWANYYMDSYFDENKAAKDIRIFHQAPYVLNDYYENVLLPSWNNTKASLIAGGGVQIKRAAITAGLGGLVYLFVALKAWCGAIDIGEVVRYYGAITQLFVSFSSLVLAVFAIFHNNEYLKLLFSFIDLPSQNYKGRKIVQSNLKKLEIELKNVSFQYSEDTPVVLKHISLKLESGKRIAIVGMNGSGKTTLIKLLCRFYDPTDGTIKLNGVDIREYDYKKYKKLFSVVFQDFKLFSFSVGQNVAGNLDYDAQKVWNALELAGLKERVDSFPKKLEQVLYKDYEEDGIDLSGGEEQKLALARAIYCGAPYVILDEPTAALDPFSEAEIYKKFDEIIAGRTSIYISHRLSSCKFCDSIVVFDEGEIVQIGTHDELLKNREGKYSELWNAQAQYYNQ